MKEPKPPEEKLFLPDPEPEPIVVKVRAVCGGLAGIVAATVLWFRLGGLGVIPTALLFIVVPGVVAYLAVRYGDTFWERWIRGDY
ncbi:hypothetical protein J2X20_000371 [Pelomonas saccharophila]|uniref:PrgI family protein n=1 Tax=Roseateles saccharophilus TaxID=304 RepID=A0ABU1YFW1_ROSSA|nr:hypothetical protein [Roseateles saccharophilus]MDR7267742.1 hypothetical protein [Roseateles saccharophilus]